MKILHISGARSWGGNEQQLVDLIPELNKLQVESIVFGMEGSPLQDEIQKSGTLFLSSSEGKIHKKNNFSLLKKIVADHHPDIIHLHTSDAVTLFVISDILYRLKTPAVLSKKGMGSSMSILSRYKYNYGSIKKIICVSEAVKNELQKEVIKKRNHGRLQVIYDGVNLDRTKVVRSEDIRELFGLDKKYVLLGNIANHAKAKDLGTMVNMMDYLVNTMKVQDIHLIQIGSFSKLTEDLKQQIKDSGLESFITLAGFQHHALDFIPQFDLYVMSSVREGLPITIFESFYKNTPVVSTNAGGIPEAIEDGVNGFLVEVGDYKGLAEKVIKLSREQSLQEQFKERSEKVFHENFVAGKTAERTFEVYNQVLEI
ncbi:MAG TPA: glycosyltransferase [Salinimicrobium catena]|uniref:Glycosyltransferase n=1 Tax=Salinimicrobium catena TaxID=390640 RepID=A0A7C2M077_9FLAO|nr:glycosyltransferase [Salinimicrobium catena]